MRKAVILILILLMTGCVQEEIIDDVNIVVGVGIDQTGEDQFKGTFLIQDFKPDESISNLTYTSEATLRRSVLLEAQKQSSEPLVTGGIRVSIFQEAFARNGIIEFLDSFQRDASVGARILMATSEGKAQELLEGDYGSRGSGTYLFNLISHNVEHRDVPITNLHIFLHDYYQKGKDVYLPRLKQLSPDKVEINGISVFKGDKVVDTVSKDNMFFFKLLVDKYSKGVFQIQLENGEESSVRSIVSKHKFKLDKKDPKKMTIHIKIRGIVKEYTGPKINPKVVKDIEKSLQKKVEAECLRLINHFQEIGTDPLGLGQFYKTQYRGFDFEKWKDDYRNLDVNVKCNAVIEETGTID